MIEWLKKLFRPRVRPEDVPEIILFKIMQGECPKCGLNPPMYMHGPEGGMNVNVFCGCCGQGYNVAPAISWAQEIHNDPKYILPQYKVEQTFSSAKSVQDHFGKFGGSPPPRRRTKR
jgi:hypothetical protein